MLKLTIGGFILIALIMIVVGKRRQIPHEINHALEEMRTKEWQGWIEIANQDGTPLFQGKMIATAQESAGALLIGGLVEQNAMKPLIEAIKKQPHTYLREGSILARCLTTHHEEVIVTQLADQDIIQRISDILDSGTIPNTCLVLSSVSIQHMDNPEGMAQFEEIWETSVTRRSGGLDYD